MQQEKLRFKKEDIIWAILISLAFWTTRLTNIRLWPIFTDEAIYTRWSQIALNDASLRFISLTDGKQPLWHWLTMVTMKVISDPLVAGRVVSVLAGFIAMIGVWFLSYELFKKKRVAFVASFLYLTTPFMLLYDRIAIVDSMLTMWGVWVLYLGIVTAKTLRLDFAMITGFALGAGLLTKSPAVFYTVLYPLNLLFISNKSQVKKWLVLTIPTMLIAQAMRNIMRLSPWMHMIARKNTEFIISFTEFFKEPLRWFWGNLPSLWKWWVGSITWQVMLTALAGLILVFFAKKSKLSLTGKKKEIVYLLIYILLPFLTAAAFGKVIFARYLLFITPAVLIIAALVTDRILSMKVTFYTKAVFVLFLTISSLYLDIKIITDPIGAPIIQADRDQYVDGFPAGWGVDEVIDFLKNQSKSQKIFLGTQGTFGLMPASFELYLWQNKNIQIKGYWPVSEVPDEVNEKANQIPTYFVYYESEADEIPPQANIELVEKFKKGKSDRFMYLYRVFPK